MLEYNTIGLSITLTPHPTQELNLLSHSIYQKEEFRTVIVDIVQNVVAEWLISLDPIAYAAI